MEWCGTGICLKKHVLDYQLWKIEEGMNAMRQRKYVKYIVIKEFVDRNGDHLVPGNGYGGYPGEDAFIRALRDCSFILDLSEAERIIAKDLPMSGEVCYMSWKDFKKQLERRGK